MCRRFRVLVRLHLPQLHDVRHRSRRQHRQQHQQQSAQQQQQQQRQQRQRQQLQLCLQQQRWEQSGLIHQKIFSR
jgi:hypothetical protein